jgi:hypothetical protein
MQDRLASGSQPGSGGVHVEVAYKQRRWKNIIEPVHTAGVPPNEGSTNLANIVSTINNRAALIKIVAENSSIMKARWS